MCSQRVRKIERWNARRGDVREEGTCSEDSDSALQSICLKLFQAEHVDDRAENRGCGQTSM